MFPKIVNFLNTLIISSPAEVEEFIEEELEEPAVWVPTRPLYIPNPAVEPVPTPEPAAEPWYPPVIQAPASPASPAASALEKVKAAQKAALTKKAELMEEQLLQEQTKTLIKEMDEAGLLPAQLMDLEVEVMQGQANLDDLLDQLGF